MKNLKEQQEKVNRYRKENRPEVIQNKYKETILDGELVTVYTINA
jgi:hypothetical protein